MTLRRIAMTVFLAILLAMAMLSATALFETQKRINALQAERSLLQTRHGQIEYAVWGDGRPILVVHGAGGGFDQGRLLAEAVGPRAVQWISVSRFGYLGSDLPADPSTAAQAEAFADLLDGLKLERVSVLAMSGGAPPALKFAEIYPDRIDRVFLLSPAPFTPFSPEVEGRPMPGWMYSLLLGNDVVYWTLSKIARPALLEAFDARRDLRDGLPEGEQHFVDKLVDGFIPASRRLDGVNNEIAAVDPAVHYDLERIRARVLIIHARDDRLNPFDVAEKLASEIPENEFIALDRGGHLLLGHHDFIRSTIEEILASDSNETL